MVGAQYNNDMKRAVGISPIFIAVIVAAFGVSALAVTHRGMAAQEAVRSCDISKSSFCIAPRLMASTDLLHASTIPKIATPSWLAAPDPVARVVTYRVETRGVITADMDEFISQTAQTLNDSRGWTRLGVRFDRVAEGGEFTLVLSEASQMTTFSADGCDSTYSCNVGNFVIINQDRWMSATPSWTEAGASLADYRHMVVNHETGHWLGLGHTYCQGAGQTATVMQQQSMSLQTCAPNAWPLQSEMYSPTLGIRS